MRLGPGGQSNGQAKRPAIDASTVPAMNARNQWVVGALLGELLSIALRRS